MEKDVSTLPLSPKPSTIVFGYHSRIMSLTEMPPNKTCRLSRVRVVVRDVTGRFCWDLIPGSADPEGSEALCYHKTTGATTTLDSDNGNSQNIKGSTAIDKNSKAITEVDSKNSVETANTANTANTSNTSEISNTVETVDNNHQKERIGQYPNSSVVRTDPTQELLAFIARKRTASSAKFAAFVAAFDPHSQTEDNASIQASKITYEAHQEADKVYGLAGCSTTNNQNNNITIGAPESGCHPVIPAIQPAALTSFDRCRQALAHVSLIKIQ